MVQCRPHTALHRAFWPQHWSRAGEPNSGPRAPHASTPGQSGRNTGGVGFCAIPKRAHFFERRRKRKTHCSQKNATGDLCPKRDVELPVCQCRVHSVGDSRAPGTRPEPCSAAAGPSTTGIGAPPSNACTKSSSGALCLRQQRPAMRPLRLLRTSTERRGGTVARNSLRGRPRLAGRDPNHRCPVGVRSLGHLAVPSSRRCVHPGDKGLVRAHVAWGCVHVWDPRASSPGSPLLVVVDLGCVQSFLRSSNGLIKKRWRFGANPRGR